MSFLNSEALQELPRDLRGHDIYLGGSMCIGDPSPSKPLEFSRERCANCGQKVPLFTDGKRIFSEAEVCTYPKGLPLTEFDLNVPSGKLFIGNDFRVLFPADEPEGSINLPFGCHMTMLAYAEIGMAHGYVGNSCPLVYKRGNTLWIGDGAKKGAKRVASISTDLWWYSIVDFHQFACRAAHYHPGKALMDVKDEYGVKVVDVRPGVYRVSHDSDRRRTDASNAFATLKWVRKPDPVIDYLAIDEAKTVTPEQYIAQSMRDWPTLFVEMYDMKTAKRSRCTLMESAMAVACQLLATNGNGVDWHENGHPRIRLDADIAANQKPIKIPVFNKPRRWYPISEGYCTLTRAAGIQASHADHGEEKLNPGFTKLAFNVLQCIIWHGQIPYNQQHLKSGSTGEKEARGVMALAVRIYWKLAERYEDASDAFPEFKEWMLSNAEYLDEYVKTVELPKEQP